MTIVSTSAIPPSQTRAACTVCTLLDGDATPKYCTWCSACAAWLCGRCVGDLVRRGAAMAKRGLEAVRQVVA